MVREERGDPSNLHLGDFINGDIDTSWVVMCLSFVDLIFL